jgi:hypothetical protein
VKKEMPSPVKRFKKPQRKTIKWGRGKRKVITYGTYKRPKYKTITKGRNKGKLKYVGSKTSYAMKKLDMKRSAHKSTKEHRRYPHTSDLPRSRW